MANPPVRNWRLLPHDRSAVERLARSLQTTPLVAQLLLNRGVEEADHARRFLTPSLNTLHKPDLLPGISDAADRILAAVNAGRKITIYGDYDVDGVTGSAILLRTLQHLGAKVEPYIPHRLSEGYGLNADALKQIADGGTSLVVTVDCGIASLDEALEARRLGLELIITDHHEMKDELPQAAVLVHPRLPGSTYPFGQLCGAGVAFKLAWALGIRKCGSEKVTPAFREVLMDSIALATLGIIADVVPLQDENRILVRVGLNRLRENPPPGIQALCEVAKIDFNRPLKSSDIGFRLAPRINAVGRLGQAIVAVELLNNPRRERAVDLARHLETYNEMRQKIERDTVNKAKEMIAAGGLDRHPALVLASRDWHGGVVGIVAGRLTEQYGRPTLMITLPSAEIEADSDRIPPAIGSGRSIQGLALHEALHACTDLLIGHGGHAMAAGFRLHPENVDAFREKFCTVVASRFPAGMPVPELVLDAEAPLSAMTQGLLSDIDRLEPYGAENRRPLFMTGGIQIQGEPRKIGQGERHLSFQVRQGNVTMRAVAWSMAERLPDLMSAGGRCSLAFAPMRNEWMGRVNVELEVVDFQPGDAAKLI